jgi:hypothetical protein
MSEETGRDVTTARAAVDKQVGEIRTRTTSPSQEMDRQIAFLNTLTAREAAALARHVADEVMRGMDVLRRTADDSAGKIVAAFDRAIATTDESTQQLARWTRVMAWATTALAVFTVAQVVIAVIALIRAR